MAVPFVHDLPATDDPLAVGVARLMVALYRKSPVRPDGRRGRLGLDYLHRLASFDDDAINSAEASGFLTRETTPAGEYARITAAGLSIFLADEVGPDDGDLLGAVARLRTVVVNVEALSLALGRDDPEATWDALGTIEAEGTVERWPDHPESPSVALTALGAGRLGLRLDRSGTRWLAEGEVDPADRRGKPALIIDEDDEARRATYFERIDPRPTGPAALIESEDYGRAVREYWRQYDDRLKIHPDDEADRAKVAAERSAISRRQATERGQLADSLEYRRLPKADREARAAELGERHQVELRVLDDRRAAMLGEMTAGLIDLEIVVERPMPLPRVLIGQRPTWPVARDADGACGACRDRPLRRLEVCLVCHRSGIDDLLGPARVEPRSKPATVAEKIGTQARPTPKVEGPAGGTAKVERPAGAADAAWDRAVAELAALRAGRKGKGKRPAAIKGGIGDLPVAPVVMLENMTK